MKRILKCESDLCCNGTSDLEKSVAEDLRLADTKEFVPSGTLLNFGRPDEKKDEK